MKVHKSENNYENQALNFKGTKNLGKQLAEGELLGTMDSVVAVTDLQQGQDFISAA